MQGLSEEHMQKIAAEMNLSETAFVRLLSPSDSFGKSESWICTCSLISSLLPRNLLNVNWSHWVNYDMQMVIQKYCCIPQANALAYVGSLLPLKFLYVGMLLWPPLLFCTYALVGTSQAFTWWHLWLQDVLNWIMVPLDISGNEADQLEFITRESGHLFAEKSGEFFSLKLPLNTPSPVQVMLPFLWLPFECTRIAQSESEMFLIFFLQDLNKLQDLIKVSLPSLLFLGFQNLLPCLLSIDMCYLFHAGGCGWYSAHRCAVCSSPNEKVTHSIARHNDQVWSILFPRPSGHSLKQNSAKNMNWWFWIRIIDRDEIVSYHLFRLFRVDVLWLVENYIVHSCMYSSFLQNTDNWF